MCFLSHFVSLVSTSVYWVACLLEVKAVSRALTQHTNIAKYCAYVFFVCVFVCFICWTNEQSEGAIISPWQIKQPPARV